MIDTTAYLARIGYRGTPAPTAATLRALHLAHLQAVPFENLDIHLGRPLRLAEDALFDKIVRRRRGGFCFELNGLFAALVRGLGFRVTLLAAQFPRERDLIAPEFDHLTLLVRPAAGDEVWLADVGAGRGSAAGPLRLETARDQPDPATGACFRLAAEGDARRLWRQEPAGEWERQYRFSLQPRALAEFEAGCQYHQTAPESHFTRGRICTRLTPTGRITLSERRLITTSDGARTERELADETAVRVALREQFGIDLGI